MSTKGSKGTQSESHEQRGVTTSSSAWVLRFRSWLRMRRKSKTTRSSKLYTHIDELPLRNFVELVITGDLSNLMRDGSKPSEDAQAVWDGIYKSYIERAGGSRVSATLRLTNQINALALRIQAINMSLSHLQHRKSAVIIDALKDIGYTVNTTGDLEAYHASIDMIRRRAAALGVELAQKKKQLDNLIKEGEGTTVDRAYFNKLTASVEKYMGFRIDGNLTSVGMFLTYIERIKEDVSQQALKHG